MKDISFIEDNMKFNYRVAFIIKKGNSILLEKNINNDYYSLLGGRVKLKETSKDAAIRELKEEIGLDINKDSLTLNSISENFFEYNSKDFHEMLFIYEIKLEDDFNLKQMKSLDNKNVELFWFEINKLEELNVRPKQLNKYIENNMLHYIIKNDIIL